MVLQRAIMMALPATHRLTRKAARRGLPEDSSLVGERIAR